MNINRTLASAAAGLLLAPWMLGSAAAAVVSYDESSALDLPDTEQLPAPLFAFELDPGVNTIAGNLSRTGLTYDFDDFIFTVKPDQILTQIDFELTSSVTGTNPQTDDVQVVFGLREPPIKAGNLIGGFVPIQILDNGVELTAVLNVFDLASSPLAAGTYLLDMVGFQNNANFDYQWTLTVAPVPLPPAAWLLISGLLAMAGLSRRKSGARAQGVAAS